MAGVIADKIGSSTKCLFGGFILVTITQAVFLITPGDPSLVYVALVNIACSYNIDVWLSEEFISQL